MDEKTSRPVWTGAAVGAVLIAGVAATAALTSRARSSGNAPGRTARRGRFGNYAVVGKTVTINRPRAELFAFWRDFENLPDFMENIEKVSVNGTRSTWTIAAPAGQSVTVESEIVEERENELIAWRSVEESQIDTEGRVKFRDAPGGRGTIVEAIIAYDPPGGEIGRLFAKLFQKEPDIQARRDLKRFKMLMEAGEIANSAHTKNDS